MSNKTAVITGATGGIGLETAKSLAKEGFNILILARNEKKAERSKEILFKINNQIDIDCIHCDLANLPSVKCAATRIMMTVGEVDVLINNAGGIFPDYSLTTDGIERSFSVNHLGHFLLTNSLLPTLIESNTRIINVSSEAHKAAKPNLGNVNARDEYSAFITYANVKLYNILFTKQLVAKYGAEGLRSYALHPGVVNTSFGGSYSGLVKWLIKAAQPFMISAKKGAETSVYLATQEISPDQNGAYFAKKQIKLPSKKALDKDLQQKLWKLSEEMIAPILAHKSI